MDKINVLFVCTGNIFRSMSAEYALKKYLEKIKDKKFNVSSAGTSAQKQPAHSSTIDELSKCGIDISKHKQRKISKKILENSDIIIVLADYHQKEILDKFHTSSILFNKLAIGKNKSVSDINDVILDFKTNTLAVDKHIRSTVNYICSNIKNIYDGLNMKFQS